MQYQYVVSAHKSSAVSACASGRFTSPQNDNLIVARGNRLEITCLDKAAGALAPMGSEHRLNGHIAHLFALQPADRPTALLLALSAKQQYAVLSWDAASGQVVTEGAGEISERTGRRREGRSLAAVDAQSRAFAVCAYQGIVHVFAVDARARRGVRAAPAHFIDEVRALDMCFLAGDTLELAVLSEDAEGARRVRVYAVGAERMEELWVCAVDAAATHVVALGGGRLLVVGDDAVSVVGGGGRVRGVARRAARVAAVAWVERGARLLVADSDGLLSLVVVRPAGVFVERLGAAPVASALAYLGDGCVFVGSACGDSLLARLRSTPIPEPQLPAGLADSVLAQRVATGDSFIEPLAAFACLAPLVDLCVAGQGAGKGEGGGGGGGVAAGSVVACSGHRTTPSIRVVRNGVGVEPLAQLDCDGVARTWALTLAGSTDPGCAQRRVLVVASLAAASRVLAWTEMAGHAEMADHVEMAELAPCGWATDRPTLAAGATASGACAVQVTRDHVTLLDFSGRAVAQWPAAPGQPISVAAVSGDAVVVASGARLALLHVRGDASVVCVSERVLPSAVACIGAQMPDAEHLAVGLWDGDVQVLTLPALGRAALRVPALGTPARSLLLCTLGSACYLLVGTGDGRLHQLALLDSFLGVRDHRCVTLGVQPLLLAPFFNRGQLNVFAACDHSAVLFAAPAHRSRLMYANVDAPEIACAAPVVGSAEFPDALCLVSGGRLWVGRPDPVQRLHVRAWPLPPWAAPHRIAFNGAVYALATTHEAVGDAAGGDAPGEFGRLSVLSAQSMGVLGSVLLEPFEMPESLCVADGLDLRRSGVFAMGSSVVLPGDDDARSGRVLLAQWDARARRLLVVGELAVLGAVYALAPFRGMLVAAVGSRLLLLAWQKRTQPLAAPVSMDTAGWALDADWELVVVCSQQAQIAALSLCISGDTIVVGDVLASAAVFRYREDGGRHRLVPVARDAAGVWTTAVAALPPPLPQNRALLAPPPVDMEMSPRLPVFDQAFASAECARFVVADAHHNIIRIAVPGAAAAASSEDADVEDRTAVEARWHLGDQINVIRAGALVMDIPDPEFPDFLRPHLLFGTLHGALGVMASVENGHVGRILDRLQTNLAHLVPTPGMWDYQKWRAYKSDQRECMAFGVLDGDLIETFLDLPTEIQRKVFT
ncbi:DNA damage-binding protein 1a, partial [Kickxella alabastrina]